MVMSEIDRSKFHGYGLPGIDEPSVEQWKEMIFNPAFDHWQNRITWHHSRNEADLYICYLRRFGGGAFYVSHAQYNYRPDLDYRAGDIVWAYTDINKLEPWIELVDDYWVSPAFFVSPNEAWKAVEDFFTMDGARSPRVKWWDKPLPDGAMA